MLQAMTAAPTADRHGVLSPVRNYWMVAVRPDYFAVLRNRSFDQLGLGRAQKKRVQRMEIGDRVLLYVSQWRVFPAIAIVDSGHFEHHERLWPSSNPEEDYPWRVRLKQAIILRDHEYLDARLISPRLQYVRRWAPEWWELAFIGPLHLIPKQDFQMMEEEMRKRAPRPQLEAKTDPGAPCALDSLPLGE